MYLYTNLFITAVCIIFAIIIWYRIFKPAIVDMYRFKLYAYRDTLAEMVVSGSIKESDSRYIFLRDAIQNALFFYSCDFKITQFIKSVISSEEDESAKKKFFEMVKVIKSDEDLSIVMHGVFGELNRAFVRVLRPMIFLMPALYVRNVELRGVYSQFQSLKIMSKREL